MQSLDVKEDEDENEVTDEAEELDNMETEGGYILAGQRRLIKHSDVKGITLANGEVYRLPLSLWHKQVVTISKFMQLETSQRRFKQSQ